MLSFLGLALINVLRELGDDEMRELMPRLERSAGPPDEVRRLRGRAEYSKAYLRADGGFGGPSPE